MENLKNLNLIDLNDQELMDIDGGGWIKELRDALVELDASWDNIKKRFKNGYDSYSC